MHLIVSSTSADDPWAEDDMSSVGGTTTSKGPRDGVSPLSVAFDLLDGLCFFAQTEGC